MMNQPKTYDLQTVREYYLETYSRYLLQIGREEVACLELKEWADQNSSDAVRKTAVNRGLLLRAQALEISELREATWRGHG